MDHSDLYLLREIYNEKEILLCFNGPFSQGLIEEIGNALKKYMQTEDASSSSALDVFAVYIELAQNIQRYSSAHGYGDSDSSATVVISREGEHYVISAGNIVEPADGNALVECINTLAAMDRAQLKAAYKERLRKPHDPQSGAGPGLGLIDIARRASVPYSCSLHPVNSGIQSFFSLRVVI
jgi:Family of unknown function (DUF6272)